MDRAILTLAEKLAAVSAGIIKRAFRTPIAVDDKADGSLVTAADREAEAAMRELIMDAFPTHGIRGEEFGDYQPGAVYQWTLDPIDGTNNFVAGSFLFGTLIGLLRDGEPILGVLNHPVTGHLLVGTPDETRENGRRVTMRPCLRIEDATLLNTGHLNVDRYHDMEAYEKLIRRARLYRTWGDCHGYFLLATGYADIMVDPVLHLWDIVPLIPIITGAGGTITNWHGGPVLAPLAGSDITHAITTAGTIHDAVIAALNPGLE